MVIDSSSELETGRAARDLAQTIRIHPSKNHAPVIALEGELGAGKTTFVQAFAKALGVKETLTSPTFVLLKRYTLHDSRYMSIIHIDAYRLKDHTELEKLGIRDLIADPRNIILIEWADRVKEILPHDHITVHIDHIDEHTRKIAISNFKLPIWPLKLKILI